MAAFPQREHLGIKGENSSSTVVADVIQLCRGGSEKMTSPESQRPPADVKNRWIRHTHT